MRLVGLTGGIGAGKSTVAALLHSRGARLIDADRLARAVLAEGSPGLTAVVRTFGPGVLDADGALDRAALGALVFADPERRGQLEAITHPAIAAATAAELAAAPPDALVVHDVPLLVELGRAADYACVVVVQAPLDVRLDRLASRGLSRADALRRMQAQASDEQRAAVADVVLHNAGTREDLDAAVAAAWPVISGR